MQSDVSLDSPDVVEAFRRLPTISIGFNVLSAVRGLIVPALVVAFASAPGSLATGFGAGFYLAILLAVALASAVLRYATFAYRFEDDELVIRKGLLTRNERHVPYQRIQNIDLVQNPLHRMAGVAVVRLETASGGKPEAVISVLELSAVEEMRARVFADRAPSVGAPEGGQAASRPAAVDAARSVAADGASRPLVEVSTSDLVLLGLISNRGMLVVAAILGVASQSGVLERPEWIEAASEWLPGALGRFAESPAAWSPIDVVLLVVGVVVGFLVLTRLLSIAWTLYTLHGFRLARSGGDLRSTYGLFTRITATIPRPRIQLLSARLSMIHRWTDRVSVRVETAGGGAGGEDGGGRQSPGAARLWLAPMVSRSALPALLAEVVPSLRLDAVRWRPLAARARRRLLRRRSIVVLLLVALGYFAIGWWALVGGLLLLGLVWVWVGRYVEHTAWALTDEAVLYRSGAFGLRVSVVPLSKIQVVWRRQTFFDRRNHMASLGVDTAGASLRNHRVAMDFLDAADAEALGARLEAEAARRAFRWS